MNNAAVKAIETAALSTGVTVRFFGDSAHCSADNAISLSKFRNLLNREESVAGCKISKTAAVAGYWHMGAPGNVSYVRTISP